MPTTASSPPVTVTPWFSSVLYTRPQLLPGPRLATSLDGVSEMLFIFSRARSTPSSMPAAPGLDVKPKPRMANCLWKNSKILTPEATCSVFSGVKTAEALRRGREPLSKLRIVQGSLVRPESLQVFADPSRVFRTLGQKDVLRIQDHQDLFSVITADLAALMDLRGLVLG